MFPAWRPRPRPTGGSPLGWGFEFGPAVPGEVAGGLAAEADGLSAGGGAGLLHFDLQLGVAEVGVVEVLGGLEGVGGVRELHEGEDAVEFEVALDGHAGEGAVVGEDLPQVALDFAVRAC